MNETKLLKKTIKRIRSEIYKEVQRKIPNFKFHDRLSFNDFLREVIYTYEEVCYYYRIDQESYKEPHPSILQFLKDSTITEYSHRPGEIYLKKHPSCYACFKKEWEAYYGYEEY